MGDVYFDETICGRVPKGLPGGFFIYEANEDETILFAENNIAAMYGCKDYEDFIDYVKGSFRNMVHPEDLYKVENQIEAQTIYGENRHDYVRYRIVTKQGDVKYVEDFGHLLHQGGGKSYYYVFIVDVGMNEFLNKNRNSYAEAEILSGSSETDKLTGLMNMSFFYSKTQAFLTIPGNWRKDISFIHFDIPNFKLYNERQGFKNGDALLKYLGKCIKETFKDDTISRFSDDHFVVCSTINKDEVLSCVDSVNKKMLMAEDPNMRVRVKAGIYFMDGRSVEVGLACDHARLACNSIKGRHDVNICVYDEMLRENLRRQQYVVDNIDEAIREEHIKVFYQPVIRVKTGEICGYEALVRWVDPKFGMLSPGQFIETLEQFHLIHHLDMFVIKKVCEDYKKLFDAGEPLVPFSINISRLDFELCDIFGVVEQYREEYDVPRSMLDLEITESTLNDNVGHIKNECDKMRKMGYKVWLDDFGSGYSSLNTIAEYEFDVLKLDMIFLRSYDHSDKTGRLMAYIIEGAKGMGLSPLCEGVESERHYTFLKRIGCERAQGYFFGKPMPLEETRAFTKEKGLTWEKVKI